MAIELIRRRGIDGQETVAVWREGEGFVRAAEGLRFVDDPVYAEYTPEQMYAEFDGPDLFATEAATQKSLTQFTALQPVGDGA